MDFFRICLMFFQRGLYMITKLNNRELFQFCEQFSIILRSGMSAIEGLAILNDDSQTERGKEILTFLYKDMEESGSLAHGIGTAIRCLSLLLLLMYAPAKRLAVWMRL
mgnify:CR=1 FL=1